VRTLHFIPIFPSVLPLYIALSGSSVPTQRCTLTTLDTHTHIYIYNYIGYLHIHTCIVDDYTSCTCLLSLVQVRVPLRLQDLHGGLQHRDSGT
jgi:hypothetical protein